MSAGALEPPIRSVLFGPARFEQHGRSLAETHAAVRAPRGRSPFFPRLHDNVATLRSARERLEAQAIEGAPLAPAAQWLVDNAALIDEQLQAVRRSLPLSYFRKLPCLIDPPLAGLPRVYGVAWAWVAHTDSGFDESLLQTYLRAYQQVRELTLAELWALPTTIRVVLVENLRRLAERLVAAQSARDMAHLWIELPEEERGVGDLDALDADWQARGVADAFRLQLLEREDEVPPAQAAPLRDWLAHRLPDPAGSRELQHQEATADHQSIRNAITSLRLLERADWRSLLEAGNVAMQTLLRSPVHRAEREDTRDETLRAVERLAHEARLPEAEVARVLLEHTRRAGDEGDIAAAPAYWWHGAGLPVLRRALGLPGSRWRRFDAGSHGLGIALYLLGLGALTWGTLDLLLQHAQAGAWAALAAVLMAAPASEAVVAMVNRLISESARPARLPRLAFEHGLDEQHRVLVVIPALLTGAHEARALAEQLEQHHLANPEPCAQFALLTDWADAPVQHDRGDDDLLEAARAEIEALNRRYPARAGAACRFLLLHRPRVWSDSEQCWIGWERKRGKIEQLVERLSDSAAASAFVDLGPLSAVREGTPYIVTLDSDTDLPPGRLRELVGVAAHPLNRPRVDMQRRRIISGYGILQPRVVTPLPAAGQVSRFHRLFNGLCGIDPYSAASSEVYQDVFGEGSYTGKGLLHVQALRWTLVGRLPEGQVLSHDLLEGSIARCATVSDISVAEDAPLHPDVAASRIHRWTRGDWQLLPFIGQASRYGLTSVHVWKMLDNLRRSLVAPLSLALLMVVLATGALPLLPVLLVVTAAFGAGPLLGAVAALAPSRDDIATGLFFRHAGGELLRSALAALWHLAMLLHDALLHTDAIVRALHRQLVSHRRLLQWTPAAAAQAAAPDGLAALLRRHAKVPLAAALLAAALAAADLAGAPVAWRWALPLLALWGAAPLWIWWAAQRPAKAGERVLGDADREYLQGVARDTWRYYADHVGPVDQHLPPDNVQTEPHTMVAHRTSPTNIGMYLLAAACARELGLIGGAEMAQRLEATLDTLERLPRHRGHFFNWYDTRTLEVLHPAYVSTVDSGNLSVHLLAVAQACAERVRCGDDPYGRLLALAGRCRALALAPDYAFLYDTHRRLLHIGYRVEVQELDPNHYDLLASEARATSLLAIAKGDVPVVHWAALGRPAYGHAGQVGLASWSGSMFEYLMPSLVLDEPAGSLLHQAVRSAVAVQRADGAAHATPWGISESAIAARDHTLAYQYGPQGVSRLALRRTPIDERVIAPYASMMAALVAPTAAAANLRDLERLGARGDCGFFEALDYTPQRQHAGASPVRVSTWMAHHQGMGLVALADVLAGGPARRWAGRDPHLRAVSMLLHERAPIEVPPLPDPPPAPPLRRPRGSRYALDSLPLQEGLAPTHLLTNGRYAVMLRSHGCGASRWDGVGLTRWRDELPAERDGWFFYLQREPHAAAVSLTARPAPDPSARYRTSFGVDRVLFDTRWPDLHAQCSVWVSAEDDCELRRIELVNTSDEPIRLVLSSAFEATLAAPAADEAHPAFSNLFVQARWDEVEHALYLARRPRLPGEDAVQAVHFLAGASASIGPVSACADRARWVGRYGSVAALHGDAGAVELPHERGDAPGIGLDTGLDPVAVLRVPIRLPPGAGIELTFGLAASRSREGLEGLVDKFRQPAHVERSSSMSHTMAGIRLRELQIDTASWIALLQLHTLLTALATREPPASLRHALDAGVRCDRRALWRHGISGDRPIVLATVGDEAGLALLQALEKALHLWTAAAVPVDLVVLNAEPASYQAPVQRRLQQLHERHHAQQDERLPAAQRSALHVLVQSQVQPDALATLALLARLHLKADGRTLAQHLARRVEHHEAAWQRRRAGTAAPLPALLPKGAQAAPPSAPRGEFAPGDGAFSFDIDAQLHPSRPWVNVLANPGFGTQVSEIAGGYTWAGNSRMHQITAWSNDPLRDPPSEWLLLQDRESRRVWVLGRTLADAGPRRVTQAIGEVRMEQQLDGLDLRLDWCVDPDAAVKQVRVEIRPHARHARVRRLRLVQLTLWRLGASAAHRHTLRTRAQRLADTGAACLQATQLDAQAGSGGATAFVTLRPMHGAWREGLRDSDWTCDRREFHDASGRLVLPDALGARCGLGLDPCAALSMDVDIAPGSQAALVALLGHAATPEAAEALALDAWRADPDERVRRQRRCWDDLLDNLSVRTPDPHFDALVNRWLPYQTLACRLWARAGFYQAGGAVGFRDQLQDAMALVNHAPQLLVRQLRVHAARQFGEGDVQHWWHPDSGAGVRTRFSDDLLWLPFAALHHLERSGDAALLDEAIPFLEGGEVPDGAEDLYEVVRPGPEHATLYEHCARAIDRSLTHGPHGLPLFGTGDWNDGMNRVGHEGRGESVWLAWFLCHLVDAFAPLARTRGEHRRAAAWHDARTRWLRAIESQGWDGRWYRRGYFDDGTPLGASANEECRIDLIAQAWAVLSGAGNPQRARGAMNSARERLWEPSARLLRLLDPALQHAVPSAGYIQAYPPGVRENGGQYNHAAVWGLMAAARLGDAAAAWQIYTAVSPAHRWQDARLGPCYALEPYVMAGDIYSVTPHAGRGGWSWYTGSAGWLLRASVESICGVVLTHDTLRVKPCLPPHWDEAAVSWRRRGRQHRVVICADEAQAQRVQARWPHAQPLAVGAALPLAGLEDGSVHLVVAHGPQATRIPRADTEQVRR